MKRLFLLIIWISSLLFFGCPKGHYCPRCYEFNILYLDSATNSIQNDSLPFIMIKNTETDSVLFNKYLSVGTPSLLYIYPLALQSTFIFFYPNNTYDTIIIQHHFVVDYDKKCKDYYFKNTKYSLIKCTFKNYTAIKKDELCPEDINIQF